MREQVFFNEFRHRMGDSGFRREVFAQMHALETGVGTMTFDELADNADYVTTRMCDVDDAEFRRFSAQAIEHPLAMQPETNCCSVANYAAILRSARGRGWNVPDKKIAEVLVMRDALACAKKG